MQQQHAGITILSKFDPARRDRTVSKVALVLAGGAVAGGAFKAGGLRALDEMLAPLRLTSFDMFVGLSAGSVLACALACGVEADELYRLTTGAPGRLPPMRLLQYMRPNLREPAERVALFISKSAEIVGSFVSGRENPRTGKAFGLADTFVKLATVATRLVPTGLFDPAGVREFLRDQLAAVGQSDSFGDLERRRRKELLVTAVDINTGTQVVFGPHERYAEVPISDAVGASCALPIWYRTARVRNPRYQEAGERRWLDLADGFVVRTANVGVALKRAADLVIVYNPFTPIRYASPDRSLYEHGAYALASQLFRTLLGSRLDIGKNKILSDPSVNADIVYIEPRSEDLDFFTINPLSFWAKRRAAEHGYHSVKAALDENRDALDVVFSRHGITLRQTRTIDHEARSESAATARARTSE
ncbi:MAG: patatin-like phospholipase family protein [Kofleriaceae bacterium]